MLTVAGGGERARASDTLHLQRAARVSHLLAYIRDHGCATVCWKIFQGKVYRCLHLYSLTYKLYNSNNIFSFLVR